MKKFLKSFCMLAACAVVLSISGCGSDDKDKDILVTGFEFDKTSPITLRSHGKVTTIGVDNVLPENATLKKYNWTSSNTAVATVSAGGTITPLAAGTTTVTITAQDAGKKSVDFNITVEDVDDALVLTGTYVGNILINENSEDAVEIELDLILNYKGVNTLTFNASGIKLDAGAIDKSFSGVELEVSFTADLDVDYDEDDELYLLTGDGFLVFPEWVKDLVPELQGNSQLPMEIKAKNPANDKLPQIDKAGNIFMRFDLGDLGEVFYVGKK